MSRTAATSIVAVLCCVAAPARAETVVEDQATTSAAAAPLNLMPRRLTLAPRLLSPSQRLEVDPRQLCLITWSRPMMDVFDVANKLGCMVMALNDGLDQLGRVLAVVISAPLRLTTVMLNTVGGISSMRMTIAPVGTNPTYLGFTPTFIPAGGGLSLLGLF